MEKKHLPFWLFVMLIPLCVTLPQLIQDGMFMDGLLYTTVSKNLANGYGTFWFPRFNETWIVHGLGSFHEHPPLIFGIQSLFFKVLGNSMYTERFYIFLTGCITAGFIILHWRLIFKEERDIRKLSWLPVFFWILTPITFWTYRHNMQENTMVIFILASVFFALKGLLYKSHTILHLIIAGLFIFAASLSKGLPGLFPLAIVMIYWCVYRDISFPRAVLYSLILFLAPLAVYGALMLDHDAYASISFYLTERVLYRVSSSPTVTSRFYSIIRLTEELLPVMLISAILFAVFKKKIKSPQKSFYKSAVFFLLAGIAGSFPLSLTKVQKGFYLVPSIPFFALGFAIIVAPGISMLLNRLDINRKAFKTFFSISCVLVIIAVSVLFFQAGKTSRHHDLIHDLHLIGEKIPDKIMITVPKPLWVNTALQCYFMRYYNASLDYKNQHLYLLIKKNNPPPFINQYVKVDLPTRKYDLYKLLE